MKKVKKLCVRILSWCREYEIKLKAYKKLTNDCLYSQYSENFENYTLTLIPYACFANRGESNMCVWLNIR